MTSGSSAGASGLGQVAQAGRERAWSRRHLPEWVGAYGFLSPWLVGFFALTLLPTLASLYLSLTDYSLVAAPNWVGLRNYVEMFTADRRFWNALSVTLTFVIVSVPCKLGFALALAVMLDRGLRGLSIYRSLFYLPSLLGGSVAIAIIWRQVFGADGMINGVLERLGIDGPSWLTNPRTAIYVLVTLSVWQFGSPMIIFLAGLRQIPETLYEAADMDGTSHVRKFWRITFPLLAPVILFNVVYQTIDAFRAFTSAYIVSGGSGGPIDSTLFFTLYLYQKGFTYFQMGYASAMAWVLLVATAVVTALVFLVSRRLVYYEYER